MQQALYRRVRPEIFSEILGQEHIVKILKNQIVSGTVGHAYVFCGTRGTGKTTTARILAKGANCLKEQGNRPCGTCANCIDIRDGVFLDVIEIDAASNNGVENIRELRESVKYPPAAGRYKVYIIDEVHMLSTGAFNALLKTLEEPPEYVIFILATTEPHKLPATVLSRCMRLDFRRVPEAILVESMKDICAGLGVDVSENALGMIAAKSDGSVRDSLSLLDQCIAAGKNVVSREDVLDILGTKGEDTFIALSTMVEQGQIADILFFIDKMVQEGIDVRQLIRDWIGHYRNLMRIKFIDRPENILNISLENIERMKEQSDAIDMQTINRNILQLAQTASDARWSTQPRILLEICAVGLASKNEEADVQAKKRSQEVRKNKVERKATEPKKAVETKSSESVDKKWSKVLEDGISQKGSLSILRNSCRPIGLDDACLSLELRSDIAERYIKDNMDLLSSLIKDHFGKILEIKYHVSEYKADDQENNATEKIAAMMENRLNISIEVE
jgi:DNA polymerase-3 subunit gamma/tau